uniref:Cilia- and flagella-associated protein 418 n=1 Tax=Crocodylus porosus TaxID=8502 RepID=A0A7M4E2P6_CROPO
MADGLDELLDQVERDLCGPQVAGRQRRGGAEERDGSAKLFTKGESSEEDIDDIINDIFDESSFAKKPVKLKSKSTSSTSETNSGSVQACGKRCCPVYLGGSTALYGIGTNISKRTCDQLRCTACDFRVAHYDDYLWDKSCDYLFFRSHCRERNNICTQHIFQFVLFSE